MKVREYLDLNIKRAILEDMVASCLSTGRSQLPGVHLMTVI